MRQDSEGAFEKSPSADPRLRRKIRPGKPWPSALECIKAPSPALPYLSPPKGYREQIAKPFHS